MGIVPAMVFVREGCPFCSKLIEELQKNGFDFQTFDIDNMESRKYLEDAEMQVRVPPLFQTADNYYVLPDFFVDCDLERFDDKLLASIMAGLTYIWN